ncbi:hypothetical protein PENSPDRAFT_691435 [Peniophora sp. CONT]|nr:hypothetical protein PENSPDRAFT_691435 [Peniophora sp. CONT]
MPSETTNGASSPGLSDAAIAAKVVELLHTMRDLPGGVQGHTLPYAALADIIHALLAIVAHRRLPISQLHDVQAQQIARGLADALRAAKGPSEPETRVATPVGQPQAAPIVASFPSWMASQPAVQSQPAEQQAGGSVGGGSDAHSDVHGVAEGENGEGELGEV